MHLSLRIDCTKTTQVEIMNRDEAISYKAGDAIEDLCRACKTVRGHTVIAADSQGSILRVICDYCGSQHNYRGSNVPHAGSKPAIFSAKPRLPLVTEKERSFPMVEIAAQNENSIDLEMLLRRIIREETGLTPVPIADKWLNGEMILRPGKADLQEKSYPIETFFHKIVMLRNRLRVLEQQINGSDMAEDVKIKLQGYITGCYGTLTSFNILFADEEDRFRGSASSD
jgi:hypothetical protein